MRLGTVHTGDRTQAVLVDGDQLRPVGDHDSVAELLARPDWAEQAAAARSVPSVGSGAELVAVIPRPGKIICVGLNYRNHIKEMGRDLPDFPTLFAKFPETIIGPTEPIAVPPESAAIDWEAELAIIIGRPSRRITPAEAGSAIAGYAVLNDVTMRDFQYRTTQWFQGKSWERSTPLGPYLVTPDELDPAAELTCLVDGEIVQRARIDDLVFPPEELVAYVSTMITLQPGDVIATGTPGGVGHARNPARYLQPGSVLETKIDGLGRQRNPIVDERI